MRLGGVLWISSDSDDQIMGAKIKDRKNFPRAVPAKPQKIPDPEINPVLRQNVKLMQKVIIFMQNVIKTLMHNVIIFQLKM